MLPVGRCRGYRTVTSALARSQLCRVPEDLAAFPDATGRRSHRGPRHQPAVTRRGPPGVGHAFDLSLTDLFFSFLSETCAATHLESAALAAPATLEAEPGAEKVDELLFLRKLTTKPH